MLKGELKTEEWDQLLKRLMLGLTPRNVGLVAARRQESLIRGSYTDRWRQALGGDITEGYRRWKQEIGASDEPGVLTGSTLRALTSEADEQGGRVFLDGSWPNSPVEQSYKEMLTEDDFEDIAHGREAALFYDDSGVDTPWGFIESEPFASKKFGTRRSDSAKTAWGRGTREIHFMEPDPADEPMLAESVGQLVSFLIDPSDRPDFLAEVFGT